MKRKQLGIMDVLIVATVLIMSAAVYQVGERAEAEDRAKQAQKK